MMSPKAASWTVLASSGSEDDWIHVLPANLSLTLDFHKNDLDVADHNCAARSCVQVPMDSQSIFRLLFQEPRARPTRAELSSPSASVLKEVTRITSNRKPHCV
jgi:hypothetical protein